MVYNGDPKAKDCHKDQRKTLKGLNKVIGVPDRIVNIYQPDVRPVPSGKDKVKTEFGANINAGEVEGMSRVKRIGSHQVIEPQDLELQVIAF